MILDSRSAIFFCAPLIPSHFGESGRGGMVRGWWGFGSAVLARVVGFRRMEHLPRTAGEVSDPRRWPSARARMGNDRGVTRLWFSQASRIFYALPLVEILVSNSTSFPDALPVATRAAVVALGSFGAENFVVGM